jgi:hypothetical protein
MYWERVLGGGGVVVVSRNIPFRWVRLCEVRYHLNEGPSMFPGYRIVSVT